LKHFKIAFAIRSCISSSQKGGVGKEGSANHETMKKDGSMD
jgi:hypothetical protein